MLPISITSRCATLNTSQLFVLPSESLSHRQGSFLRLGRSYMSFICYPVFNSRSKRSASQIRARVVASVVRSLASLVSTAFMAGGRRMLS
jgi:hypothetical protein